MILVGLIFAFYYAIQSSSYKSPFTPPLFIAHASGGNNGLTYLNSLEALNHNYDLGIRYFEVDFSWTSDSELVLIHDWKQSYKRLFNNTSQKAPSEIEFLQMTMNFDQTQLSLKQFSGWMKSHPDAVLITDIKRHNIKGLKKVLKIIEDPFTRIIPQVYHPINYQRIKDLGFNDILFTMYKTKLPFDELVHFIKNNNFFALSIRKKNKHFTRILNAFGDSNLLIYYLVVNKIDEFNKFKSMGIDGGVTDYLYLHNNIVRSHQQE
jgi:glycerophosphoryl diester phosphodiesterase